MGYMVKKWNDLSYDKRMQETSVKGELDLAWLGGKGDPWKLCKRLKFEDSSKWCVHKLESALENETLKILWDFEVQTDLLIPARRPDVTLVNKKIKTCYPVDFLFQWTTEGK